MEEKKHIDRLFQEKLKDYEVFPEPDVWKNIELQLTKKKRKRIVPLWLRLGGAAAILLLLVNGGLWYLNQEDSLPTIEENTPTKKILETDQNNTLEVVSDDQNEILKTSPNNVLDNEQVTSTPNNTSVTVNTTDNVTNRRPNALITEKKDKNQHKKAIQVEKNIAQSSDQTKPDTNTTKNTQYLNTIKTQENLTAVNSEEKTDDNYQLTKKDITDAIEENLKEEAITDLGTNQKWSIGTTVAPVYFNSLNDGSPIDQSLANSEKIANTSLSYGVKINYNLSKKLTLQTGVNSVELAYKTKGVTALISSSELQLSNTNINTNIDGVNLITLSTNQIASQSAELDTQRGFLNLTGDLNQSLSYIEIPTEIKYAVTNKKVGIHVVGGVSTYILYSNQVSLFNQNGKTTLGEASNINDVNFSGNLGLDLDYKINKKLFINVSPMFKYQMNTFSKDDGGFTPYFLGVYTGLNFRF